MLVVVVQRTLFSLCEGLSTKSTRISTGALVLSRKETRALQSVCGVGSLPFRRLPVSGSRFFAGKAMSEDSFESIPEVKLDNGRFKYVLIKVHDKNDPNRSKLIVRGSASATYHADIYEREMSKIESISGLETECLGGGRIIHNPDCAEIKVFGYSQGYGQADHSKAVEVLKRNFPEYKSITWSNDGY
ncbi:14 kDa phosphohistidine phosphatase-like [Dermacentor variabilis]|uniref:14 kDa phosphohistidine phosphatase-like n=1 Tax=Dermacentor variabilis TaxID=34621 RepID=UPI003F5BEF36